MSRRISFSVFGALLAACGGASSEGGAEPTRMVVDGVYSLPSGTCASFDQSLGTYRFWSDGGACAHGGTPGTPAHTGAYSLDPSTGVLALTDEKTGVVYTTTLSAITTSPLSTVDSFGARPEHIDPLGGVSLITGVDGGLTAHKTIELLRAEDSDSTGFVSPKGNLTAPGRIELVRADTI